jgi:DNA-binding transcriptional ArsR family regulator
MTRPYRIGSLREFKDWTLEVVRNPKAAEGVPKRWYDSDETAKAFRTSRGDRFLAHYDASDRRKAVTVVRLISDNLPVLEAIGSRAPASIRELAAITGRSDSNLHRSLKKLQRAGLVAFRRGPNRTRRPVLTARKVRLEIDLGG